MKTIRYQDVGHALLAVAVLGELRIVPAGNSIHSILLPNKSEAKGGLGKNRRSSAYRAIF